MTKRSVMVEGTMTWLIEWGYERDSGGKAYRRGKGGKSRNNIIEALVTLPMASIQTPVASQAEQAETAL